MTSSSRQDFNTANIAEFRRTGGTLTAFGDAPVLLLTTTGARSGQKRVSPMMYLADEQNARRVYVFASKAGADTNPAWYHNLVADPEVTVEIGSDTVEATAHVVDEPERTQLFDIQAERYPGFRGYEQKTTRVIPVVALELRR